MKKPVILGIIFGFVMYYLIHLEIQTEINTIRKEYYEHSNENVINKNYSQDSLSQDSLLYQPIVQKNFPIEYSDYFVVKKPSVINNNKANICIGELYFNDEYGYIALFDNDLNHFVNEKIEIKEGKVKFIGYFTYNKNRIPVIKIDD